MPRDIRYKRVSILTALLLSIITAQAQSFNCLNVDDTGLIQKAYNAFENDLFSYYKQSDTVKTYRTFLAEVASLSIDLRKLPSSNSIQLARMFKKNANNKNSIWVRLSDYEQSEATKKSSPYVPPAKGEEEEILIFNYRGGFIQCLKNTSGSDDFQEIVQTLEDDGNVSTSLISQKIYYLTDKDLLKPQVKKFVAFDIYFSILMVIEKAFG